MHKLTAFAIWFLSAVAGVAAQDAAPAFEVASIKPAAPGARGSFIRPAPGGRLEMTNMTLKNMIMIAYRVQPFQITGGPPWFDSDHYDVIAKAEKPPGPDQLPLMLQALLAERFGLKFQRETKDMPVYALVSIRSPGKSTPGLKAADESGCGPIDPAKPVPPPSYTAAKRPCGMMQMTPSQLNATSRTLADITSVLSRMLGRTVIDKTGNSGKFDIHLEWTPDESQTQLFSPDGTKPPAADSSGPSIFAAVQEQLGLKLEAQKGPVEILAVERAERPSAN